jgi:hypothetical protein
MLPPKRGKHRTATSAKKRDHEAIVPDSCRIMKTKFVSGVESDI